MAATVTLSSTTLAQTVGASDGKIKVASTSGMRPGLRLFVDRELMTIISLDQADASAVNVHRGRDGTAADIHSGGAPVWIASPEQLYDIDPKGAPPLAFPVSPYINVRDGRIFFAQGDTMNPATRWWQIQTTTYSYGALGVLNTVVSPTSST